MSKTNPLFVDSTKFQGEQVSTQVELRKVLLYDDESLFVVVTNHLGFTLRTAMRPVENSFTYEARVHLNHQTPIRYRFVIEKNGRKALHSTVYKGRAQYAIIMEWDPALKEPLEADENLMDLEAVDTNDVQETLESSLEDQPDAQVLPTEPRTISTRQSAPASSSSKANTDWARESSMNVRSLIEKWGL